MTYERDTSAAESERDLAKLREPPTGRKPLPPPRTLLQMLPFNGLEWSDFEKLIERLVAMESDAEYVSRYGTEGQEQGGIDIFSRLKSGHGYAVYQCKRYSELRPADIRNAVSKFLQHRWAQPGPSFAGRFVFCTSHELVPTALADEMEEQARRLREHESPIVLDAWGEERLSRELKSHPALVEEFFGPPYPALFSPGSTQQPADSPMTEGTAQRLLAALEVAPAQLGRQQMLVTTLSWAPKALQETLQHLADSEPETFVKLRELVGEPPDIERVVANLELPAAWLEDASATVWQALSLMAETKGRWAPAAAAWTQTAERIGEDYYVAGAFCSAAACANISGDPARHNELLARARERYPRHPRLIFEEVRQLAPEQQIAELADVETREPGDIALVAAQRALAYLFMLDIDAATREAARASQTMPGSTVAEAVEVNVVVQRARLNQVDGLPQNAQVLRQTTRRALDLRDQLLRQGRWEESGRTLMLAADTLGLQGELSSARDLLMTATADELAVRDGAEVIAHAALRTLSPREALTLTENAERTPAVRYIRATAMLEKTGTSAAERTAALAELDALVAGEDQQVAMESALARLADTMDRSPWSNTAEAVLVDGGHERPALLLRAFYLGARKGDWEGAYALFDGLDDRRWVRPGRLMVALNWGRHSVMKQAADDVMALGPGQMLRLSCGRAYALAGEGARAREVLMSVAVDDSAPSLMRAEAYMQLVRMAIFASDWETANDLHQRWVAVRPGDTRASSAAPLIAARLTRQRRDAAEHGG